MHDEKPAGKLPESFGLIINLDISKNDGTHWVSLFRNTQTDNETTYFDSFGLPPSEELRKRYNITAYNASRHQHERSQSCGLYALAYLKLALARNMRAEDISNYFTPDITSPQNEKTLRRLFSDKLDRLDKINTQ